MTRACLFDDIFRFGADGSFTNVMGDETWLEPWQGAAAESCGAPVAPHDGSYAATYVHDEVAIHFDCCWFGCSHRSAQSLLTVLR